MPKYNMQLTVEPLAKLGILGIAKEADIKTPSVFDDLFFKPLQRRVLQEALLFVAFHQTRQPSGMQANVLVSYPAERIDFDATKVPPKIVNTLEEAITCHANSCYVAAAIMIRKALEELCHDQNASGTRLVDQIKDLKNKVIIPTGLLNGIDNLRLLGNDAAHVELKDFDQIGAEEAEVGILFTKELLKAVYQSSLIAERLGALKK